MSDSNIIKVSETATMKVAPDTLRIRIEARCHFASNDQLTRKRNRGRRDCNLATPKSSLTYISFPEDFMSKPNERIIPKELMIW